MKEVPVPADAQARVRKKNSLARARKAYNALTFALALVAIACLVGLLVVVIVLEMRENSAAEAQLLYILTGSFAAGATVLAFGAFFCGKAAQSAAGAELDYRERCDGAESFFVGEGTLLTFEAEGVRLHAEEGGKKPISVPYRDMKFYSVCTRRKPREKGEWSVVFEMPSRYVVKEGEGNDAPPRALIQADGKVDAETDSLIVINSAISANLSLVNGMIKQLSSIFLYVGITLAAFAMLLLFNFISVSIANKKKEIGILRAVGARSADVFKIFYSESIIITAICFVLAMIASFVVCGALNNSVAGTIGASIFVFGPLSWLVMLGIAVVTSFVATFLPVFNAARRKPVESIRAL